MSTTVAEFVRVLSKLRPSSTFLVLHRYKNAHGEVADYNILFHISYRNAVERSLQVAKAFKPASDLQKQARLELISSFETSLAKIEDTPVDSIEDNYIRFFDEKSTYIKGIKMHRSTHALHLYGFIHQKKVISPIEYPVRTARMLTVEKNKIRALCPVNRFRQFIVLPTNLQKISVEKNTLLPPDPINTIDNDLPPDGYGY